MTERCMLISGMLSTGVVCSTIAGKFKFCFIPGLELRPRWVLLWMRNYGWVY